MDEGRVVVEVDERRYAGQVRRGSLLKGLWMPVIFSRVAVSLGEWVFWVSACFSCDLLNQGKMKGKTLFCSERSCHGANSCTWRNICLLCDDSMLLLRRLKTLLCVYSILADHICYSFQLDFYVMWFIISIKQLVMNKSPIHHTICNYLHASACVERCGRALMESSEKDLMTKTQILSFTHPRVIKPMTLCCTKGDF